MWKYRFISTFISINQCWWTPFLYSLQPAYICVEFVILITVVILLLVSAKLHFFKIQNVDFHAGSSFLFLIMSLWHMICGCSCIHNWSEDQMCRPNSCVHSSAEEAIAAEESLLIYCKPVELYNILHRRALKNVIFCNYDKSIFVLFLYFL